MAAPDPQSAAGQADWEAILRRVLPHVDVFLPSLEEILYMTDRPKYEEYHSVRSAATAPAATLEMLDLVALRLLAWGAAVVGIKLGEEGLFLRTSADVRRMEDTGSGFPQNRRTWPDRQMWAPCFQVDVVGTTGAGDCTVAGFLAGLTRGLAPEAAITYAVAVGACNVESADATGGIRPWDAVTRRIAAGWPRSLGGIALDGASWREDGGIWVGPRDRLGCG